MFFYVDVCRENFVLQVEAFPEAIKYWERAYDGKTLDPGDKYQIETYTDRYPRQTYTQILLTMQKSVANKSNIYPSIQLQDNDASDHHEFKERRLWLLLLCGA